jgi:outer membrane protein OmpA-like peptidoglycan-associated protein
MSRPLSAVLLTLAASVALSGCFTPRAKVAPSAAVLEARKRVEQKTQPCLAMQLADVSPTEATFPYDSAELDEAGARKVGRVAAFLACHAATPVVVLPSADSHGDKAHQAELATQRAQAVTAALRAGGAKDAVIHMLAMGAEDTVAGPHVVVHASGRGW